MMADAAKRALDFIAKCTDPKQIRQLAANARRQGEDEVHRAAQLRLYEVLPAEKQGTLEYDVWQSIYALEGELSDERGKTTRLSRTRQKIARDGEQVTVSDLVLGKVTGYASIREGIARLLNRINRCGGRIVYYGRLKYLQPDASNPSGLYTTVMGHTIRAIDDYCCQNRQFYMMILDENSERKNLLETAAKTMFGETPARCLIEPPFEVESHLYQTVQAADWIASLVGKIAAYRMGGGEYTDWEWSNRLYGRKLRQFSTHSTIWTPSNAQRKLALGSAPAAPAKG